jgi:ABC-type uncharacterized transport system auxiliary subunit
VRRAALALLAAASLAAGCLAPQPAPRAVLYVLRPERDGASQTSPGAGALHVAHLRAGPLVEGTGFVYRTGEVTFETDAYHRFAAPPGVLVREALIDWLARSGVFSQVHGDGPPERARWSLEARVAALHADVRDPAAPLAVLELDIALVDPRAPAAEARMRQRYRAAVPTTAEPAAVAQAWSRGLAQILGELERDLRARNGSAAAPRQTRSLGALPRDTTT